MTEEEYHPVNTDDLILNIFNNKLGLETTLHDICRKNVIGKAKNGKAQVIVRIISHRTRQQVY